MLIQILCMFTVVVNTFFCLSKSMDLLVFFPVKENSCAVSVSDFFCLEVLDKVSFTVYSLYTVDDRFFAACIIVYDINPGEIRFVLLQPL